MFSFNRDITDYLINLVMDNYNWYSFFYRSNLSMKNLDIPSVHDANEPRSLPGQCIEFDVSGLEQDAGQNIVPFIDIQPLLNNPPTPLSGAGLFLRGSADTGGFLAPKLFTFNVEPYMKLDLTNFTVI